MATDATGTPTALGIPKYNTSVDAPSGLGFNAAMDAIDAIITTKSLPTASGANQVPVWNGSSWVAGTVPPAGITPGSNGQVLGMLSGAAAWLGGLAKIAENTPSSGATTTFSSIPNTYKHLLVVASHQIASGNSSAAVRFNGDSAGANYVSQRGYFQAATTNPGEFIGTLAGITAGDTTSVAPVSVVMLIPDYATSKNHTALGMTFVSYGGSTGQEAIFMWGGRHSVSAVISSISFDTAASTWASGSVFSLYGIG